MAEQQQESRLTGPRKKGIGSIISGAIVGAGVIIGGYIGGIAIGSIAIYNMIKSYSPIKKAISIYKSAKDNVNEKAESYLGQGICYLGDAVGTILVPWLKPAVSTTLGAIRLYGDSYIKGIDHPEIELYKKKEKEETEKAVAEKLRKEEEEKGKKDK